MSLDAGDRSQPEGDEGQGEEEGENEDRRVHTVGVRPRDAPRGVVGAALTGERAILTVP